MSAPGAGVGGWLQVDLDVDETAVEEGPVTGVTGRRRRKALHRREAPDQVRQAVAQPSHRLIGGCVLGAEGGGCASCQTLL